MIRLLERDEARPETRRVGRGLAVAGIFIAVVIAALVCAMRGS